jgi:hypothetical protein
MKNYKDIKHLAEEAKKNIIVQIAYAGSSTALRFDSAPATAFCPSTAAVKVGITQIQL